MLLYMGVSAEFRGVRLITESTHTSLKQEQYLSLERRLHKPDLPTWESMALNLRFERGKDESVYTYAKVVACPAYDAPARSGKPEKFGCFDDRT
jgi:hypothetical protein